MSFISLTLIVYVYHNLSHPDIYSAISDAGSDTSSIHDPLIDYGSTPGGQGDGSLDREKAEGEVTLRDMSVSSFLDEVSMSCYCNLNVFIVPLCPYIFEHRTVF